MSKVVSAIFSFLLVFLLFVGFSSCASQQVKREKSLKASVDNFNQKMRWQRYGEASRYIKEEYKDEFLEKSGREVDLMHITDVQVISTELDKEDDSKGKSRVWVTYYRLPSANLVKDLQIQTWTYDPIAQVWNIDLPEFEKSKQ